MANILMLIGEKTPCVKTGSLNLQVVEYIWKYKQGQCGPGAFQAHIFAYLKRKLRTFLIQQKYFDIQLDRPLWNHSIGARAAC